MLYLSTNDKAKDCWGFLSAATFGEIRLIEAGRAQVEVYPKTSGKKSWPGELTLITAAAEEDSIIRDIYLIAKGVKEHLNEPNCTHNIRFIVKQALENKSGLENHSSNPADDTTTPEPTRNDR